MARISSIEEVFPRRDLRQVAICGSCFLTRFQSSTLDCTLQSRKCSSAEQTNERSPFLKGIELSFLMFSPCFLFSIKSTTTGRFVLCFGYGTRML